jgi:cobyric acid synthase CobQ
MPTKCLMIQGTSSNAGKSFLATGLCRLFYREGFKVAPFKSQNMSLNSYITQSGGEIAHAQGIQAQAAGVIPTVEMNPILLMPKEKMVSQVIVLGQPLADMNAGEYRNNYVPRGIEVVREALGKLRNEYDLLIIEGAGSPAEINLKEKDIANMKVAFLADAPVILVADIDRGGSFASIIGTLELFSPQERDMVAGFVINKFRGDAQILKPGIDYLEKRTGLPVLGVIPYVSNHGIEEEDSVSIQDRSGSETKKSGKIGKITDLLDIAVIKLPRISNHTDFGPLDAEEDVVLRYVDNKNSLGFPDAIIIPGSKNTTGDLYFLRESGLAGRIMELNARGVPVVGICGGFQMLGRELHDPEGIENQDIQVAEGLGLLPVSTIFTPAKITRRVKARVSSHASWGSCANLELDGYDVRHGKSEIPADAPCISIIAPPGIEEELIGASSVDLPVWGTYLHDIFHNDLFRRRWLNILRKRAGLRPLAEEGGLEIQKHREQSYDSLAALLREHLDLEKLFKIIGMSSS